MRAHARDGVDNNNNNDFFKELGCWGQEGNGSIGGALVGIFVWFGNRYYFC